MPAAGFGRRAPAARTLAPSPDAGHYSQGGLAGSRPGSCFDVLAAEPAADAAAQQTQGRHAPQQRTRAGNRPCRTLRLRSPCGGGEPERLDMKPPPVLLSRLSIQAARTRDPGNDLGLGPPPRPPLTTGFQSHCLYSASGVDRGRRGPRLTCTPNPRRLRRFGGLMSAGQATKQKWLQCMKRQSASQAQKKLQRAAAAS